MSRIAAASIQDLLVEATPHHRSWWQLWGYHPCWSCSRPQHLDGLVQIMPEYGQHVPLCGTCCQVEQGLPSTLRAEHSSRPWLVAARSWEPSHRVSIVWAASPWWHDLCSAGKIQKFPPNGASQYTKIGFIRLVWAGAKKYKFSFMHRPFKLNGNREGSRGTNTNYSLFFWDCLLYTSWAASHCLWCCHWWCLPLKISAFDELCSGMFFFHKQIKSKYLSYIFM